MEIQQSMKLGNEGEDLVLKLLNTNQITCKKNTDIKTALYWDLEGMLDNPKLVNRPFTVEIKNDNYSLKSNNIAIEILNTKQNKPSGLSATKADYWAIVCGEEVWLTKTSYLRSFVAAFKPEYIIDNAGDNNAYILLYKKEDILPAVFVRIDKLSPDEIFNVLDSL